MRIILIILCLSFAFQVASAQEEVTNKITRIDLVVNSLEKAHLEQALEQLIKISSQRNIRIGAVFQIGDLNNLSSKLQSEIRARGGEILSVSEPPMVYPVTSSPAWMFISKAGTNIVEGSNNIERFISAEGMFLTPEDPEFAEKVPTPQKGPEGFNVDGF